MDFRDRKHPRLRHYDYSLPGYYYVTIHTEKAAPSLSVIRQVSASNEIQVVLTPIGELAKQELFALENRYPHVRIDKYVIMPTHIHVILQLLVAEWKDKYVRLQAEFDNYRKRTLREKMELVETGGKDVLLAMLPVKDDVERAVAAMMKTEDVESVRQGVQLIAQKFTEALKQRGVTQIEVVGLPFDEEVAEAVARFAAGEEQKGLVIDCVQTGYRLGERVLRFAKVVVGE